MLVMTKNTDQKIYFLKLLKLITKDLIIFLYNINNFCSWKYFLGLSLTNG